MLPEWYVSNCWMQPSCSGPLLGRVTCKHNLAELLMTLSLTKEQFVDSSRRECA